MEFVIIIVITTNTYSALTICRTLCQSLQHTFFFLFLIITPWGGNCFYLHFRDEKVELREV